MRAFAPKALAERDDSAIKDSVLTQLETLGFSKTDVASAVQKSVHNSATASYYLLYGKLTRLVKEQRRKSSSSNSTHASPPVLTTTRSGAVPPHQPQSSAPTPSSATTVTPVILTAVAKTGAEPSCASPAAVSSAGAQLPPSHDSNPRHHSTQPSHCKENAVRTATPSGASPRHQPHHPPPHQHQPQQFAGQPVASSSNSQQPRRPSSVRSGRTLVVLTNSGAHHPASSTRSHSPPPNGSSGGGAGTSPGVVPVPPRDRRPPGVTATKAHLGIPSSNGGSASGARVAVSNGLVALSPLTHHAHHLHPRREGSDTPASHTNSRRHTLEISQHAAVSPRNTGVALVAAPALSKTSEGSTASSSVTTRRRITLQPGTSLALESAQAVTRVPDAADVFSASAYGTVTTNTATPVGLKEDDSRQPQAALAARIQVPVSAAASTTSYVSHHHPQPPPTRPSPAHIAGVL